eukprot:scaffold96777_cov63-Phaeocystis_antarctica.AAC.2
MSLDSFTPAGQINSLTELWHRQDGAVNRLAVQHRGEVAVRVDRLLVAPALQLVRVIDLPPVVEASLLLVLRQRMCGAAAGRGGAARGGGVRRATHGVTQPRHKTARLALGPGVDVVVQVRHASARLAHRAPIVWRRESEQPRPNVPHEPRLPLVNGDGGRRVARDQVDRAVAHAGGLECRVNVRHQVDHGDLLRRRPLRRRRNRHLLVHHDWRAGSGASARAHAWMRSLGPHAARGHGGKAGQQRPVG